MPPHPQAAELNEAIGLYQQQLEDLEAGLQADPGNEEAREVRAPAAGGAYAGGVFARRAEPDVHPLASSLRSLI